MACASDESMRLIDICGELDSYDIASLKYLCQDDIDMKRLETSHETTEIFQQLSQKESSVEYVGHRLCLMERPCLVKMLGLDLEAVKSAVGDVTTSTITQYTIALFNITKELSMKDVMAMIQISRDRLSNFSPAVRQIEKIGESGKIFEFLNIIQKKNLITPNNVSFLYQLLYDINREDLVHFLEPIKGSENLAALSEGSGNQEDNLIVSSEQGIGLGILLMRRDHNGTSHIYIQDVKSGSPADKDGRLKKEDMILEVNGRSLQNLSLLDAHQIFRGLQPGNVTLVIKRKQKHKECLVFTRIPDSGASLVTRTNRFSSQPAWQTKNRLSGKSQLSAITSHENKKLYKRKISEVDESLETKSMEMYDSGPDYFDTETLHKSARTLSPSCNLTGVDEEHTTTTKGRETEIEMVDLDVKPTPYPPNVDTRDPRDLSDFRFPPSYFSQPPLLYTSAYSVPLLMSSIVCDGHAIDCIIDRRLVEYYYRPRKTTKDFLTLKEDIEKGKKNAFQNLIMVSSLFKERKQCLISLSRELLILSVKTKQDLLCRLLLSYIPDRANQLPDLLGVLSIAMGEEQNHSANAIAWLITKTFFLAYKVVLLDCILDVWPALKCKCKGEYEKRLCSSHVVIVVELESEIKNERIPDKYFSVEVVFLTNGISNEKNTKAELQDSVADVHFADDKPITGLSARNLFAKHRKLTLISKSSFQQHGIEKQCVNLFCRVKGFIPIGENHLPRSFCSLPTKIQQGRPQFMTNIRVGDTIGTDDFKKGTLGGFLKVRGDNVFLTCLHILLSTEDLASENITLNDEQPLSIKCYPAGESSTASNTTSYVCGKIRDIAFKTDNCESTSIDAALIKVKKGIKICPTDYAVTGNENTVNHDQIGLHSPFLNNSCVDFRKFCYTHPKPSVSTVSVGAISGIKEQVSQIMENREFGIDMEPFYLSFNNVVLDGMKHMAACVTDIIKRYPNPLVPIEKQITNTVEEQCKDQCKEKFSTETKQNIANIVYEVCMETGTNGDASLDVNKVLHRATVDNTSNSFSAIIGDVHMQTTFLKWTVDRETSKRTSRKMYGQIHVTNIPFKPGDSGSCIYVTHPEKGCIGLAIADHPNGGCIATPIMEILKHFNIRHGQNQ